MSDILSQDEIDRLLQAISSGELTTEQAQEEKKAVKTYDFRRPSKFSKEQIRTFDMVHESFARSISTYLSGRVRTFVSINLASIDQIAYEEFVRSLPSPSFIVVFSAPELVGSGVLEFSLDIFYTRIDLILGGPGIPNVKRNPSEIEISIMRKEIMNMLTNLAEAWSDIVSFVPVIESIETNPQFVQIAPANEMVLLVTLFVSIGKTESFINICWPSSVTEPFSDKLSSRMWFAMKKEQKSQELKKTLVSTTKDVSLNVSAVLGETVLTLHEILELGKGDVIRLKTHYDEDIFIDVEGTRKFTARPGIYKGYRAVKITGVLKPEVE